MEVDDARTRASHLVIRPRISSASLTVLLNLVFCKISEGMPIPTHEMYFSSISTCLNFLILKCQGMDTTPFDTHPKTMTAAIFSFLLLVYSVRVEAEAAAGFYTATTTNGIRVVSHFVCLFWSFTFASLVSLMLPDCIRPILYLLCFLPLNFELLHSFYGRISRKFEEWLNVQRISILRQLMINQRWIGRLPV